MNSYLTKKTILLCLIFIETITSGYAAVRAPVNLIFISDTLCGMHVGANPKLEQSAQILKDISEPENRVQAVVVAGNLTFDGSDDAFDLFREVYIRPISQLLPTLPHGGLYLCKGNHDEDSGKNTRLLQYLKDEYGKNFRYSFDIEGLHIVCCGKYPDKEHCFCGSNTMKWLQADLQGIGPERPVVIFFNFNIMGPFSHLWPKSIKDELFDLVKNYNVKGIFFGQLPYSFSMLWRDKIRVAGVGGQAYAFCTYDPSREADEDFDVKLKDGEGYLIPHDAKDLTSAFKEG